MDNRDSSRVVPGKLGTFGASYPGITFELLWSNDLLNCNVGIETLWLNVWNPRVTGGAHTGHLFPKSPRLLGGLYHVIQAIPYRRSFPSRFRGSEVFHFSVQKRDYQACNCNGGKQMRKEHASENLGPIRRLTIFDHMTSWRQAASRSHSSVCFCKQTWTV